MKSLAAGGSTDPLKVLDRATLIATREIKVGAFAKFNPEIEAKIKARATEIAEAFLKLQGVTITPEIQTMFNLGAPVTESDTEVDDLLNLDPIAAQDLEF